MWWEFWCINDIDSDSRSDLNEQWPPSDLMTLQMDWISFCLTNELNLFQAKTWHKNNCGDHHKDDVHNVCAVLNQTSPNPKRTIFVFCFLIFLVWESQIFEQNLILQQNQIASISRCLHNPTNPTNSRFVSKENLENLWNCENLQNLWNCENL